MLVDTDVLIWFMRGNQKAYRAIAKLDNFAISAVSYMELVQGMRNKQELNLLRKFLQNHQVAILHISEDISTKALFLVEQYYLSHTLLLADALIGATAVINGITLLSGNTRHYKFIKNIMLKQFRP